MDKDNLISEDVLADLFSQLDSKPAPKVEMTEEELASQRRYEEIIKKHKNCND